jgi:hypothetical protein
VNDGFLHDLKFAGDERHIVEKDGPDNDPDDRQEPRQAPEPKAEKADPSGIPNPTQATKNAAKTP